VLTVRVRVMMQVRKTALAKRRNMFSSSVAKLKNMAKAAGLTHLLKKPVSYWELKTALHNFIHGPLSNVDEEAP
jgi:hypothetical protein